MANKNLSIEDIERYIKDTYEETGDPNEVAKRPNFYGTGVPSIDYALGGAVDGEFGGFPAGHITEVFGGTGCGKTTLAYTAIAHTQKTQPDKINVILDYEHTTDPRYIKACGVEFDKNKLRIHRPETMEQGFEYLLMYMATGKLGMFVIDSLAAMNPRGDMEKQEKDMGAAMMASKARLLSQILRNLVPKVAKTDAALVFINHEMQNINMNPFGGYQPPTTTPGGNALKYYTSMRIKLDYKNAIADTSKTFDGNEIKVNVGKKISAYVDKFKFGNPGQRVEYILRAGEGIDTVTPVIGAAEGMKIIKKDKQSYVVNLPGFESVKVRGADAFREYVKNTPELLDALTKAVSGGSVVTPAYALPSDLQELSDVWEPT